MRYLALSALIIIVTGAAVARETVAPSPTQAACDAVEADTKSWTRTELEKGVSAAMPKTFKAVRTPMAKEGVRLWRSELMSLSSRHALWSDSWVVRKKNRKDSPAQTLSQCESTIAGRKVHLVTYVNNGRYSVTAWFQDSPKVGNDFLVGGEGVSRDDQRLLLAIVRSVRFEK